MTSTPPFLSSAVLAACIALAGCAGEVVRHPTTLAMHSAGAQRVHVLSDGVTIRLDSHYERRLNAGTEFAEIGTLREGRVLKPVNATFTIEGRHHHEAYPVLQGNRVVGFYLPVEQSFSPLSQPVTLTLSERKPQ
jgi:hypothetical protein